ncbi:hypothetical protein ID866_2874 [Astraeus odoratus]|nr:hypothetical protein ID866_2874 [Astraeus odoratus]
MITLQEKEAQDIVSEYEGRQVSITALLEVGNAGFSYTPSTKIYDVTLVESSAHYLLLTSPLNPRDQDPTPGDSSSTVPLPVLSDLLSKIASSTDIPVPKPVAQAISGTEGRWNFGWLLLLVPETAQSSVSSLASLRPTLSARQLARVELRLGTYLRALHGITNESFGRPLPPSPPKLATALSPLVFGGGGDTEEDWSRYSWQDTFVLLLEELLFELTADGDSAPPDLHKELGIDVEELRRYLSRAIGAFLFDDVEAPGLIWVTGNDANVLVSLSLSKSADIKNQGDEPEAEADIAYLLPTFSHALWGDPLMEAWFMSPGPSRAVTEGYFGEEGGRLIVFPRQKTKRVWYTVYLALLVLAEGRRGCTAGAGDTDDQGSGEDNRSKVEWARDILPKCVATLKDAPCY